MEWVRASVGRGRVETEGRLTRVRGDGCFRGMATPALHDQLITIKEASIKRQCERNVNTRPEA
jgi:hypothetical protein